MSGMEASDDFRRRASRTVPHGHAETHSSHEMVNARREDAAWRGQPGRSQQHPDAIQSSRTQRDHRDDPDGAGGRSHGYSRDGIGPGDHGAGNGYSRRGGPSSGLGPHQGGRERPSHLHADFGSPAAFPADRGAGGGRWTARPAAPRDQHGDHLNDSRNLQDRQRHQLQQSSWHQNRRDEGRVRGSERQGSGNGDGAAGIPMHAESSWPRRTERSTEGGDADRGGGGGRRVHGSIAGRNMGHNVSENSSSAMPRAGDQSGGTSRDAFRGDGNGGYLSRGRDGDGEGGGDSGAGRRDRERDRGRRLEEDSRGRFNRRIDSRDLIRSNEDDMRVRPTPENGEGRHGQDHDGRGYGGQRDQHSNFGGPGGERHQRRDYPRRDSRDRGTDRDRRGGGNPSRDSRDRAGGGRVGDSFGDRDRAAEHDRERRRNYNSDFSFRPDGSDARGSIRGERREDTRRHEPWRDGGADQRHSGRDRYNNGGGDAHRGPGRGWPGSRDGGWNGGRDVEDVRMDPRGRGYAGDSRTGDDGDYHGDRGREFGRRRDSGGDHARGGTRPSRYDGNKGSGAFGICDGQWVSGGATGASSPTRGMTAGKGMPLSTNSGENDEKGGRGRSHVISSTSGGKPPPIVNTGSAISGRALTTVETPRRPRWDKVGPTAAGSTPSVPSLSVGENPAGGGGKKKLVWGGPAGGNTVASKKRPLWATGDSSGSSADAPGQGVSGNGEHGQPANEAEERWQKAAAALGPAERQVKFLRLLGAKGAASAAATGSGSAGPGARNAEARASSEMSSTVADGTTGAHKVMQDLEMHYQKAHRAHFGCQRGLGN